MRFLGIEILYHYIEIKIRLRKYEKEKNVVSKPGHQKE